MAFDRNLLPILIAAGSWPLSANLEAAPARPEVGATSRASIEIRVSVAPRMGVSGLSRLQPPFHDGKAAAASLCVWSTSPQRGYTVTLERVDDAPPAGSPRRTRSSALARDAGSEMAPAAGKPIDAVAQPSPAACPRNAYADGSIAPAARERYRGQFLLLLAPQ